MNEVRHTGTNPIETADTLGYDKTYEYFPEGIGRLKLAEATAGLALYLKNERIKNLILVDRSVRPAFWALRVFWKRHFGSTKFPSGVYFVNPRGFLPRGDYLSVDIPTRLSRRQVEIQKALRRNDVLDWDYEGRTQREIEVEFKQAFSKLISEKEDPTLLFDNCIHTGRTIIPLINTLENVGFSDLIIGTASRSKHGSINPDFCAIDHEVESCLVFGDEMSVQKTFNHVYSKSFVGKTARMKALGLRREIERIITTSPI